MIYPVMRELAVTGAPVRVTCRVSAIAEQPVYRRLKGPASAGDWDDA